MGRIINNGQGGDQRVGTEEIIIPFIQPGVGVVIHPSSPATRSFASFINVQISRVKLQATSHITDLRVGRLL